jgi:ABC-type dipeptide/oligopeptide/nickel transport system ATPase component
MSESSEPILVVRGLSLWLGREQAHVVRELDLSLGEGEILAIAGESGAGKSQAAAGLIGLGGNGGTAAATGQITFGDETIEAGDFDRLAGLRGRGISMVTQESMASLTPVRRIGDLLSETLDQVGSEQGGDRARELLLEVGFTEPDRVLDSFAHELSGGMRQRVAFALALAADPHVLIADEPTTALDLRLQASLMALMSRLRESRDMSILLITHDLAVIAQMADRTLIMREGSLVECGPTDQLFADPGDPYTRTLIEQNRLRRRSLAAA